MMLLTKFCDERHNISSSKRLLIGNFYKYRSIGNHEIADKDEAYSYLRLPFRKDIAVSSRWLDSVLRGIVRFNPEPRVEPNFRVSVESDDQDLRIVERRAGEDQIFIDGSIKVNYQLPNSFVFCVSLDDGSLDRPFSSYNSRWSIQYSHAQQFASFLGRKIYEALSLRFIADQSFFDLKIKKLDRLYLKCRHFPVIYEDKFYEINSESEMPISRLFSIIERSAFQKGLNYSNDREYRFVFDLFYEQTQLSISNINLFIDCETLRAFVE